MRERLRKYVFPIALAVLMLVSGLALLTLYPAEPKQYSIVYIIKTLDNLAFWNSLKLGMEVASKETGADITTLGVQNENDVAGQNEMIETAILKKPDAIILSAADCNSQVDLCLKAADAGIALVTVDSDINSDIKKSYIGTDSYNAGKFTAEAIKKVIPSDGQVAVISFVSTSKPGIDREKGFMDGLTKEQRENVVGPYFCDANIDKAYEITKNVLADNPDLDAIVGLNEPSLSGVVLAVKEENLQTPPKIAGIDGSSISIQAMEEGLVDTIILQNPFNMGYLSVKTTVDILNGKEYPKIVDTGVYVITKENMYYPENQKLLFTFAEE